MWIHSELSGLIEEHQEVGNKLIAMKWNQTSMENKNWQYNSKENVGVLFWCIDTCQEWWNDINKLKTNWILIKWNYIQDESTSNNLLTRKISLSIFDFGLQP